LKPSIFTTSVGHASRSTRAKVGMGRGCSKVPLVVGLRGPGSCLHGNISGGNLAYSHPAKVREGYRHCWHRQQTSPAVRHCAVSAREAESMGQVPRREHDTSTPTIALVLCVLGEFCNQWRGEPRRLRAEPTPRPLRRRRVHLHLLFHRMHTSHRPSPHGHRPHRLASPRRG
jgi:hypothetical protein